MITIDDLEPERYYYINGNKVLYWDGEKWHKAVKDRGGRYGGYIMPLENQPKKFKSIEIYNVL